MNCTAIVLAAGQGKRMKSKIQKQFLLLKGKPVLFYSISCFEKSSEIDDIIIVTGAESVEYVKREIVEPFGFQKVKAVVTGGKERYDSVYEGLKACQNCDYVFIHDGARPFVTEEMIERGKKAVIAGGACVLGVPSKDTVKITDEEGFVESTPKRARVWNIQTPQIFSYDLIKKAHESIRKKDMTAITDDAMVVEQESGVQVRLVEGSYQNIKITTPEDLDVAEVFLKKIEKM